MGRLLALLEASSLFTATAAISLFWRRGIIVDWLDVATVLGQAFALSLCCIVAFYYNDLYDLRIARDFSAFASRLLQSFGVTFILLAVFYRVFPEARLADGAFVSSFLIIAGLLLPMRAVTYAAMRRRPFMERVLVLGNGSLARQILEEIEAQPHFRYEIVGVVPDAGADEPAFPYRTFGPLDQLAKIVEETRADRVVVALSERRGRLPMRALLECQARGLCIEDGVETYERLTGKVPLEWLAPSTVLFSDDLRKSSRYMHIARGVTMLASLVGLVAAAPVLAVIALAIKLDSRGPVLFVQDRIGRYGRPFRLLKFRTMLPGENRTSEWVRDNDARITRVGKWLRRFRLDELPQFVNILRGDMSLVGPRPHPASNFELFADRIPHYALRTRVRPGVTGWAQVRFGYANDLAEEIEKMRFDLFYIRHLSFWMDVHILFDTVKIVLFGRGSKAADAYRVDTLPKAVGQ